MKDQEARDRISDTDRQLRELAIRVYKLEQNSEIENSPFQTKSITMTEQIQKKKVVEVTDRMLIVGLYDLLAAMCLRLWNEVPMIHLDLLDGDYMNISPSDEMVTFAKHPYEQNRD